MLLCDAVAALLAAGYRVDGMEDVPSMIFVQTKQFEHVMTLIVDGAYVSRASVEALIEKAA